MIDEGPPKQPETTKLPAVPEWAIKLTENVNGMRDDVRGVRADIAVVSNDLGVVKDRVTVLERRANDADRRASTHSERVRGESSENLRQDAALAEVITKQKEQDEKLDALTTAQTAQTEMLTTITNTVVTGAKKFLDNPKVKVAIFIASTIAWGAIMNWAARHGIQVPQ